MRRAKRCFGRVDSLWFDGVIRWVDVPLSLSAVLKSGVEHTIGLNAS
jgi:hypothetical protein